MRHYWFPIWKRGIFSSGKEIEGLRGGVRWYVAQAGPKIDAARAKKHRFRMETNYGRNVCADHLGMGVDVEAACRQSPCMGQTLRIYCHMTTRLLPMDRDRTMNNSVITLKEALAL